MLLRVRDEFGDVRIRRIGAHHQQRGRCARERERDEIARRVEGELAEQRGVDRECADGTERERLAVGRGLGHELGADVAAGAGFVLDHDRLLQLLGQGLSENASGDVGRGAGAEGDDHADRPGRVVLRAGKRGDGAGEAGCECKQNAQLHGMPFVKEPGWCPENGSRSGFQAGWRRIGKARACGTVSLRPRKAKRPGRNQARADRKVISPNPAYLSMAGSRTAKATKAARATSRTLMVANPALSEIVANIAAPIRPTMNATACAALAMPKAVPPGSRLTFKAIMVFVAGIIDAFRNEARVNART